MPEPTLISDRYEVVRPLGRGSFGQTLLAKDRALGRKVVVKVLHPHRADDVKAFELFEREAQVLRDLSHPGIPKVHVALRASVDGVDSACLVMEHMEGTALAELIAEGRHLEPEDVKSLFIQLLDVLEYLHSRVPPVLHRDIKPANVIVRGGSAALVDFGTARNVFRGPNETGSTVAGTYGYMPYEQYMGRASASSDLYALGATFLHLATGRPPADFLTDSGRIAVPDELPGGRQFGVVLTRLLAHAPGDRYQSAAAARAALTGSATALVPAEPTSMEVMAGLEGPLPRPLTGRTAELFKRVTYGPWGLLEPETHPDVRSNVIDYLVIGFFSVLTIGILPAVFLSRWITRRRRMKPFLVWGTPATARVLDVRVEKIEFGAKLSRVRYEFAPDGRRRVGADWVHPAIAERWDPGSELAILYIADRDFDSVIVGGS